MQDLKVAVLGPEFFGYSSAIVSGLNKRNITSIFFDERQSNSLFYKIIYRFSPKFVSNFIKEKHFNNIYENISKGGFTHVWVLNPENVDSKFLKRIKELRVHILVYMWDNSANKKNFPELIKFADSFATFDPKDAKKYNIKLVHLFADDSFCDKKTNKRTNKIVFLATLHSDRSKKLFLLEELLSNSNAGLVKLLYYHSRFFYLLKCILGQSKIKYLFDLQTRGFSKSFIANQYNQCKFVFDSAHNKQSGLTARTFEALRSGAILITHNQSVALLPKQIQEKIILLDERIDLISQLEKCNSLPFSNDMDYYLSLDRFLDDLLNLSKLVSLKNVKKETLKPLNHKTRTKRRLE